MAGYNANYFNRNLIESMKQTIMKSIVNEGKKPPQDPMPSAKNPAKVNKDPLTGGGLMAGSLFDDDNFGGDWDKAYEIADKANTGSTLRSRNNLSKGKLTPEEYASKRLKDARMMAEREIHNYGRNTEKGKLITARLAEIEKKHGEWVQSKKQPAEPAVPGLKGQPAGAGPDERATAAGQQLPPSASLKAPTTPPPVTPSKAAQFGSSMFGGPGRVVSSTSTTAEGKPETTVGITPGETPRQRQMADPELQGKINPEKDLSGFFDVTRGIFNRSATPTGKSLEPQDIRPEPTTQMPTPRQASGASIQSAKPGQIPQNVIDALRKPMGPRALK